MRRLAPYQSGVWLAEYLNNACQLCRVFRSESQDSLLSNGATSRENAGFRAWIGRNFYKGLLCQSCHNHIKWLPTPFNVDISADKSLTIQAASYYEYPIRQAIRAFKYQEEMTKLPLLVHVLRQLQRPNGCHAGNSVIIPMPTTTNRLKERGFDPVTVLSPYLSQYWQIPLWHGVQRIDSTVRQQGLTRSERLTNLDNAFILSEKPPVKRLLLFDDVATTGASLQSLARTLLEVPARHDANAPHALPSHTSAHSTTCSRPLSAAYHIRAYALAHGTHR